MCLPVKPYKVEQEWTHAGLLCAVTQPRPASSRCGYVRVPPTHPWYGKDYNDVDVSVHGGLTFSHIEPCVEHEDGQGWWFGFDCAHWQDAMYDPKAMVSDPGLDDETKKSLAIHRSIRAQYPAPTEYDEHYWTEAEVAAECESLAEQLAAIK